MGVVVTYNSHAAGADAVVRQIVAAGGKAVALALDVGNVATFAGFRDRLASALQATWGRDSFDGLVNNAGYGNFNAIASVTEAEFDGLLNVHLKGPFFLTQALLPLLADGGQYRQHDQRHRPRGDARRRAVCGLQGRPGSADALYGEGIRCARHSRQRHFAGGDPYRHDRRDV